MNKHARQAASFRKDDRSTEMVAFAHSGPIPPAAELAAYNQVIPGAAERIMAMAEQQAIHRQVLEKAVIHSDIRRSYVGLFFGLLVGLSGILAGAYVAIQGQSVAGSVLGGTTIVSLAGSFIYGSQSRRRPPADSPKNE